MSEQTGFILIIRERSAKLDLTAIWKAVCLPISKCWRVPGPSAKFQGQRAEF